MLPTIRPSLSATKPCAIGSWSLPFIMAVEKSSEGCSGGKLWAAATVWCASKATPAQASMSEGVSGLMVRFIRQRPTAAGAAQPAPPPLPARAPGLNQVLAGDTSQSLPPSVFKAALSTWGTAAVRSRKCDAALT